MGRRTLQWAGHVARMDKSRLPRRFRSLGRWLKLFGLLMHVGRGGKRSKTDAALFHKRHSRQEDGGTSEITLPCGGTMCFTPQFTYLGSMIH